MVVAEFLIATVLLLSFNLFFYKILGDIQC